MAEPAAPDGRPTSDINRMPVSPWALVVCLVVYIALALQFHSVVLNWIVGPLFLLIVLDVIPRTFRLVAAKVRSSR